MMDAQTSNEQSSPVLLEHLFRRQTGRIISCLAGRLGANHLQLAEDSVQQAMLRALQTWPFQGIPENPEAWLFRVAHNAAISALRHAKRADQQTDALLAQLEGSKLVAVDVDIERNLRDDELRMIFMCCHPELAEEMQVALSLKLVCGFSIGEIARLYLAEDATIAQRIVRAKRIIREKALPLIFPRKQELTDRLTSVLNVIYLMFSSGYATGTGQELIRKDVCAEALRIGRLIADSSMAEPRMDALVAVMAFQSARLEARTDAAGELVLLEDQDRSLWDDTLIRLGFYYFDRSIVGNELSEWHVQAAIAATYAKAQDAATIDWQEILSLYDELRRLNASPVVELNRAVAVMKVHGADAALDALAPLAERPELRGYYLLPAVRGRFLAELDRFAEARAAYSSALECDCSAPERRFIERQRELAHKHSLMQLSP